MRNSTFIILKNPTKFCGIFCLLLLSSFVRAQAKLELKDTKQNFGFVKKGEVVKLNYEFKNSGNAPLIISGVEIGCSCTTVDFPKEPILPNVINTITIIFDTKTVYDRQDRTVLINTNGSAKPIKLRYKGVVLSK